MSVCFTSKVIYGFHVSRDEFNDLKDRIGKDDAWEVYDDYMIDADGYDENSDLFFIIENICETYDWKEFDIYCQGTPMSIERIIKFQELFPNREKESPKYYLIQRTW